MPYVLADEFRLPVPGVMVHLSPPLDPPLLKGIRVHADNPLQFDFILDRGDSDLSNEQLKNESSTLIKYFLASLTIPEQDLWVNLSPYEKERIIPNSFGLTEMGRDLLAEDYMLKQITASLIYPEEGVGKRFWKRVYEEASKRYGTTNIPVNTFNKVWIVPEKAVVFENPQTGTAYIVESKLKVLLEQDYLSLKKHSTASSLRGAEGDAAIPNRTANSDMNALGSQVVREIVIPELTTEINENKNFAKLRQVYNSLILATWYKNKIKSSILSEVYADKNKVAGVNIDNPKEKDLIYQRYLKAFKKGVYNYIKEDVDPTTQEMIPRKYFSGGMNFAMTNLITKTTTVNVQTASPAMIASIRRNIGLMLIGATLLFMGGKNGFTGNNTANGPIHQTQANNINNNFVYFSDAEKALSNMIDKLNNANTATQEDIIRIIQATQKAGAITDNTFTNEENIIFKYGSLIDKSPEVKKEIIDLLAYDELSEVPAVAQHATGLLRLIHIYNFYDTNITTEIQQGREKAKNTKLEEEVRKVGDKFLVPYDELDNFLNVKAPNQMKLWTIQERWNFRSIGPLLLEHIDDIKKLYSSKDQKLSITDIISVLGKQVSFKKDKFFSHITNNETGYTFLLANYVITPFKVKNDILQEFERKAPFLGTMGTFAILGLLTMPLLGYKFDERNKTDIKPDLLGIANDLILDTSSLIQKFKDNWLASPSTLLSDELLNPEEKDLENPDKWVAKAKDMTDSINKNIRILKKAIKVDADHKEEYLKKINELQNVNDALERIWQPIDNYRIDKYLIGVGKHVDMETILENADQFELFKAAVKNAQENANKIIAPQEFREKSQQIADELKSLIEKILIQERIRFTTIKYYQAELRKLSTESEGLKIQVLEQGSSLGLIYRDYKLPEVLDEASYLLAEKESPKKGGPSIVKRIANKIVKSVKSINEIKKAIVPNRADLKRLFSTGIDNKMYAWNGDKAMESFATTLYDNKLVLPVGLDFQKLWATGTADYPGLSEGAFKVDLVKTQNNLGSDVYKVFIYNIILGNKRQVGQIDLEIYGRSMEMTKLLDAKDLDDRAFDRENTVPPILFSLALNIAHQAAHEIDLFLVPGNMHPEYFTKKATGAEKVGNNFIVHLYPSGEHNPAMQSKGGIDLTPSQMHLQTLNAGQGIKFHLNPAMLQRLQNAPGFTPVVININPLKSLPEFLGISEDQSLTADS